MGHRLWMETDGNDIEQLTSGARVGRVVTALLFGWRDHGIDSPRVSLLRRRNVAPGKVRRRNRRNGLFD